MKKFFILFVCLALMCSMFIIPASAADLNWKNYITNLHVEAGYNIVTVTLPAGPFSLEIEDPRLGIQRFNNVHEASYSFLYDPFETYNLHFMPSSENFLWIGNIPIDTEINVYLDVAKYDYSARPPEFENPPIPDWNMDVGYIDGSFLFYDSNYQVVSDYSQYGVSGGTMGMVDDHTEQFMISGALWSNDEDSTYPVNVQFFRPLLSLSDVSFDQPADVTFTVTKYEIVFHIDSLVAGGEYSEPLEMILSALINLGFKYDVLTNTVVQVPKPPNSIVIEDFNNLEGSLLDNSMQGLNQMKESVQNLSSFFPQFYNGFGAIMALFDSMLARVPILSSVLYVFASIGIIGFLFKIGSVVTSGINARRSITKNSSQSAKQIKYKSYQKRNASGKKS